MFWKQTGLLGEHQKHLPYAIIVSTLKQGPVAPIRKQQAAMNRTEETEIREKQESKTQPGTGSSAL